MGLEFERLQKFIVPLRYDIELIPDLEKFTFKGNVQINLDVRSSGDTIVMHCVDLDIENAQLVQSDHTINNPTISINNAAETVKFSFEKPMRRGRSTMDIIYSGILHEKLIGFYRTKYTDRQDKTRYAAITQFEPTSARRCFPCFDEPDFKASFDITILASADLTVLSNMAVKEHNVSSGLQRISFRSTPLMSTYLVAICIGDFDFLETKTQTNVAVSVYTPIGKATQGRFALKIAKQLLEFYEEYYQIPLPLPKLDLIAITDFAAGAMENWGLVTYRESAILFDAEETGMLIKQRVGRVVAHELAHMWFGNLVTMVWWNDLWLNEAYASFQEFLAIDHVFPEYDIWTQFVTTVLIMALDLDSLKTSHPVDVPIGHPSEIASTFDRITYSKGSSLIRMLHNYVGKRDFQRGVSLYLNRHKYSNAVAADLWVALEEMSKKPVGPMISTWTKQTGFPLITLTETQGGTNRILVLHQKRFCADRYIDPSHPLWIIPIQISTSKNPEAVALSVLMQEDSVEVVLPNVEEKDWVKLNFKTTGFYRVLYSNETYQKFEASISAQTMPAVDRIGVLNDLLAMVKIGFASTVVLLDFLKAFVNETHYAVWTCLAVVINRLENLLSHTHLSEKYSIFVRVLLSNISQTLGWDSRPDDTDVDFMLRAIIFDLLVKHDDDTTLLKARAKFKDIFDDFSDVKGDLRNVVYRAIAKTGKEEDFLNLLNAYRKLDSAEEKTRILRVIGYCRTREIHETVLQFSLSSEVRMQDTLFCWFSVVSNPKGAEVAWDYFQENLHTFIDRFPPGSNNFNSLVTFVTENFATEEKAKEIEDFFEVHSVQGSERTVKQSVETVRLTRGWIQRDLEALNTYFEGITYSPNEAVKLPHQSSFIAQM